MSIVVFVDSEPDRQDEAVELAIAVAEFCNEGREPLYLACDATTALEIGASLLGTRQARTVEGGAYSPSTVRLLPTLSRSGTAADDLAGGPDDEFGGGVEELFQLGLFARPDEGEGIADFGGDPAIALERAIATVAPSHVIGLGRDSAFWVSFARGAERAASAPILIEIDELAPTDLHGRFERVRLDAGDVSIGSEADSGVEIDELAAVRRRAERTGAIVGRLFEELGRHR